MFYNNVSIAVPVVLDMDDETGSKDTIIENGLT